MLNPGRDSEDAKTDSRASIFRLLVREHVTRIQRKSMGLCLVRAEIEIGRETRL